MAGIIYYKVESWETYPGSKKYNYYITAVDEAGEGIEHGLNDHCWAPLPWSKIHKSIKQGCRNFERIKIFNWHDRDKKELQ